MKLAEVKNSNGKVIVTEAKNRYGATEYIVEFKLAGQIGWGSYTYKSIESAMAKYKKVTKQMMAMYMESCK